MNREHRPVPKGAYTAVGIVLITVLSGAIYFLHMEKKKHITSSNNWVEFMQLLKESNTGLIKVRSGDNWIFWADPVAEEIFGYKEGEMAGVPLANIMPEVLVYNHEKKMFHAMDQAKLHKLAVRLIPVQCQAMRKDGIVFNVTLRIMVGDQSVFVVVNRESETKFIPINPHSAHERQQAEKRFHEAGSK